MPLGTITIVAVELPDTDDERKARNRDRARRYRAAKRSRLPCSDCGLLGKEYHSRFCAGCSEKRREAQKERAREYRRSKYKKAVKESGASERAKRRQAQKEWYKANPDRAREKGRERMRRLREKRYNQGLDATGKDRDVVVESKTRGRYVEHGRRGPLNNIKPKNTRSEESATADEARL